MARILYSSQVNEIKGSIGGLSFQRNQSGTICRLKPSRVQAGNNLVQNRKNIFGNAVSAWAQMAWDDRLEYDDLAADQTFYDYWGTEKTISGYNLCVKQYCNCITCGETWSQGLPASFTPTTVPTYNTEIKSGVLSVWWATTFVHNSDYLLVFMTPPVMTNGLKNRKLFRLVKVISPGSSGTVSVETEWLSVFGFPSVPNPALGSYNIVTMVVAVRDVYFLNGAGNIYLYPVTPY